MKAQDIKTATDRYGKTVTILEIVGNIARTPNQQYYHIEKLFVNGLSLSTLLSRI
jgi:hypothetical protein